MATESASQVYTSLLGAGFDPQQATVMTAIAGAESGFNDTALGDLNLEDGTWGPSYGLYQVRTLKGETGSGQTRDVTWLAGSDTNQAAAAFAISHGGTDFTPWSTYSSGAYQRFLGQAQAAAGNPPTTDTQTNLNPLSTVTAGARGIAVEGLFVVLGLGLVGLGVARLAQPRRSR